KSSPPSNPTPQGLGGGGTTRELADATDAIERRADRVRVIASAFFLVVVLVTVSTLALVMSLEAGTAAQSRQNGEILRRLARAEAAHAAGLQRQLEELGRIDTQ